MSDLLTGFGKFIGWLSGSVVGITALIYSLGYLAVQSYLHVLGLDVLIEQSDKYYLEKGELLVIHIIDGFFEAIEAPSFVLTILSVVAAIIYYGLNTIDRIAQKISALKLYISYSYENNKIVFKFIAYCVLLFLFIAVLSPDMDLFKQIFGISDLLFESGDNQKRIAKWIIEGKRDELKDLFFNGIISNGIEIILGFVFCFLVTKELPYRYLLMTPFTLVLLLYILFLPIAYGTLMITPGFFSADITIKGDPKQNIQNLLLISNTDTGYIFWNTAERNVLWISKTELEHMKLNTRQSPFK